MITGIIGIISAVLSILKSIFGMQSNQQLIDAGKAEEAAAAEQKARAETERARRAEAEAEARHAKDKSDDAFDTDFERKD